MLKTTSSLVSLEICHTLGYLFRPGAPEFELYKTDETDVKAIHGLLFPLPQLNSKGVRIKVL